MGQTDKRGTPGLRDKAEGIGRGRHWKHGLGGHRNVSSEQTVKPERAAGKAVVETRGDGGSVEPASRQPCVGAPPPAASAPESGCQWGAVNGVTQDVDGPSTEADRVGQPAHGPEQPIPWQHKREPGFGHAELDVYESEPEREHRRRDGEHGRGHYEQQPPDGSTGRDDGHDRQYTDVGERRNRWCVEHHWAAFVAAVGAATLQQRRPTAVGHPPGGVRTAE